MKEFVTMLKDLETFARVLRQDSSTRLALNPDEKIEPEVYDQVQAALYDLTQAVLFRVNERVSLHNRKE